MRCRTTFRALPQCHGGGQHHGGPRCRRARAAGHYPRRSCAVARAGPAGERSRCGARSAGRSLVPAAQLANLKQRLVAIGAPPAAKRKAAAPAGGAPLPKASKRSGAAKAAAEPEDAEPAAEEAEAAPVKKGKRDVSAAEDKPAKAKKSKKER